MAKIVGVVCACGSSLAVGPEGPMVHIGAAVASCLTLAMPQALLGEVRGGEEEEWEGEAAAREAAREAEVGAAEGEMREAASDDFFRDDARAASAAQRGRGGGPFSGRRVEREEAAATATAAAEGLRKFSSREADQQQHDENEDEGTDTMDALDDAETYALLHGRPGSGGGGGRGEGPRGQRGRVGTSSSSSLRNPSHRTTRRATALSRLLLDLASHATQREFISAGAAAAGNRLRVTARFLIFLT